MFTFKKTAAVVVTSLIAASTLLTASASSTDKLLSSNFTLVNLAAGTNNGNIQYVKPDGSQWRASDPFTFAALGDQLVRAQYFDELLPAGSGSVVVSTEGPVGAVVQIQAREQAATNGAYIGVSEGAAEASVPLVMRRLATASGLGNSQIIVQNASGSTINAEVLLINSLTGATDLTKAINNLAANASFEYDLDNEGALPEGWYGSAVVRSTTAGGEVAVVSNLFSGDHGMQTFNAFTTTKTKWGVPLFASRLANSLSTPIAVQNKSGAQIAANAVTVTCIKSTESPGQPSITVTNNAAIGNGATYFFNPVIDLVNFPDEWYGSCTVDAGSAQTAVFVQMRVVNGNRAAAYEGIALDNTDTRVVIPLYARMLANSFASNATILNLSATQTANVTLSYKGNPAAAGTGCTVTFTRSIPPGGSLLQNHRVDNDVANSVPEVGKDCYGTLTVTSDGAPIDAFVQLDTMNDSTGDAYQAHNAFTLAASN